MTQSLEELKQNLKLDLPVKDVFVTQPFGAKFLDFYKKLGLAGHNGIDFRARRGCPIYASHSGVITRAGTDGTGGVIVEILSTKIGAGYKTTYYHLLDFCVKEGDLVKRGDRIGRADNTGIYTTGDHLHFGLKFTNNGQTINYDNGYRGCVDPAPYFKKDWERSNAYHRYNREERNWTAEFNMRFKNAWLHRRMMKAWGITPPPTEEIVNALVYGGWDADSVLNPAMYDIWRWAKKDEYLKGRINFQ